MSSRTSLSLEEADLSDRSGLTSVHSSTSALDRSLHLLEDEMVNPLVRAASIIDDLLAAVPKGSEGSEILGALGLASREIRGAMGALTGTIARRALVSGEYEPSLASLQLCDLIDDATLASGVQFAPGIDTSSLVEVDPAPIRTAVSTAARALAALGIATPMRIGIGLEHSTLAIDFALEPAGPCESDAVQETFILERFAEPSMALIDQCASALGGSAMWAAECEASGDTWLRLCAPVRMRSGAELAALEKFRIPAHATVVVVDDSRLTRTIVCSRVAASLCARGVKPITIPPLDAEPAAEARTADATAASEREHLLQYEATLTKLVRTGPVVLFSDQELGAGVPRGTDVISRVRAAVPEAESNLVAFVVSSNGSSSDRRLYAAAGVDGYVSKERDGLTRARAGIARACAARLPRAAPPGPAPPPPRDERQLRSARLQQRLFARPARAARRGAELASATSLLGSSPDLPALGRQGGGSAAHAGGGGGAAPFVHSLSAPRPDDDPAAASRGPHAAAAAGPDFAGPDSWLFAEPPVSRAFSTATVVSDAPLEVPPLALVHAWRRPRARRLSAPHGAAGALDSLHALQASLPPPPPSPAAPTPRYAADADADDSELERTPSPPPPFLPLAPQQHASRMPSALGGAVGSGKPSGGAGAAAREQPGARLRLSAFSFARARAPGSGGDRAAEGSLGLWAADPVARAGAAAEPKPAGESAAPAAEGAFGGGKHDLASSAALMSRLMKQQRTRARSPLATSATTADVRRQQASCSHGAAPIGGGQCRACELARVYHPDSSGLGVESRSLPCANAGGLAMGINCSAG